VKRLPFRIARGAAAVAVALTVLTLSGVAQASTPIFWLDNYVPVAHAVANNTYDFATTTRYWSVVAARPEAGNDLTLTLKDSTGATVATSTGHSGRPEWVAIDSNTGRRPLGGYTANVRQTGTAGRYRVELAQGTDSILASVRTRLTIPAGSTVLVRDVYLKPGDYLGVTVPDDRKAEVHLMDSMAAFPPTWVPTVDRASRHSMTQTSLSHRRCQIFTAPITGGWHGLVMIGKTPGAAQSVNVYPSVSIETAENTPLWKCPDS
jgi:hypothetical protein